MGIPPELELSEPVPPSPSTYYALLDQLPAPHVGDGKDHLSYISRMLLEEDTAAIDSLLYDYPSSALVTEQPFDAAGQIAALSTSTSDDLATWPVQGTPPPAEYYSYRDMIASEMPPRDKDRRQEHVAGEDATISLPMDEDDEASGFSSLFPAANNKSGTCCSMDVISMAFFKGMEEANRLLPGSGETTTLLARGRGVRNRKRLQPGKDDDATTMGSRSSKQKQLADEEEAAAREMLGRLMLDDDDDDPISHAADVQQELLIGSSMEQEKKPRGGTQTPAVDLHALLIRCAEAVATGDWQRAMELLHRIRHHSSPTGNGTQRLAHYFAQGLEARLTGTGSLLYQSLAAKSASASTAGILKIYKLYKAACSILPLGLPISTNTTYKAAAGRKKLHVVQYGLGPGFHWPDLLRMLSHREGGPPEVRLTGIDNPLPGFHPGQLIEETGRRLGDCAHRFRVPFKFRAIAANAETVRAEDIDIDPEEVLVVVSHFHFRTLMDESVIIDRPNPRDTVLRNIKNMRPKVFIHAILNGSYNGAFFVSQFREALSNFDALFDLMDFAVPRECQNRLQVEHELARRALNIIACEGVDRVERPQNYKQWHARCERAGLRQLPLDQDMLRASKDKVNKEYRKYTVINEDRGWLLKAWKGRVLSAVSTWTAEDDTFDFRNDQQ